MANCYILYKVTPRVERNSGQYAPLSDKIEILGKAFNQTNLRKEMVDRAVDDIYELVGKKNYSCTLGVSKYANMPVEQYPDGYVLKYADKDELALVDNERCVARLNVYINKNVQGWASQYRQTTKCAYFQIDELPQKTIVQPTFDDNKSQQFVSELRDKIKMLNLGAVDTLPESE